MVKSKILPALALAFGVSMLLTVRAQTPANPNAPLKGSSLTAADYVEIQQLVYRYAYAVDTHADNGYAYADLFAPDGVFGGRTTGREALAKVARDTQAERAGPLYPRHFLTNVIIHPAPGGGATGRQYLVAIDVGENGKPGNIIHGGRYDDVYVKTPQGWRFKSRQLNANKLDPSLEKTTSSR